MGRVTRYCVCFLNGILLFTFLIITTYGQFLSEKECAALSQNAKCTHIKNCSRWLGNEVQNKRFRQLCGFEDNSVYPIVCCEDDFSAPSVTFTEETCGRHKSNERKGQKAWDKCKEYQETLVFPCKKFADAWQVFDDCLKNPQPSVLSGGGGVDALRYQFPHMALLGYGKDVETARWLCGGSLISEKFILTAGHCISSAEHGSVTFVALGILSRSDPERYWRRYKVKNIINYPLYAPPSKYHDIALLETETTISLDKYVVPACLHTGEEVDDFNVSATGWGALGPGLDNAVILQNIPLYKRSQIECSNHYPVLRLMTRGYDHDTQMCYGDDGIPRDTCTGDSGGPIQILNGVINCMYTIVGITSFGRQCLVVGEPGVYTRVSYYVPWIESIVWP